MTPCGPQGPWEAVELLEAAVAGEPGLGARPSLPWMGAHQALNSPLPTGFPRRGQGPTWWSGECQQPAFPQTSSPPPQGISHRIGMGVRGVRPPRPDLSQSAGRPGWPGLPGEKGEKVSGLRRVEEGSSGRAWVPHRLGTYLLVPTGRVGRAGTPRTGESTAAVTPPSPAPLPPLPPTPPRCLNAAGD